MLISERFEGSRTPFEGDRLLMLRSLPEGAQVTKATITLTPVALPGGVLFEESISFTDGQGEWGARKREASPFSEVDFHARRTHLRVAGSGMKIGVTGASLQVDIGGLFVQINALGAMSTPDDGVDDFSISAATGGILPSLATQKFKLTLTGGSPHIDRVDIRTTPSNLTLRLDSQPSFWARPGELARAETVPDFSVILNAFLAEAQAKDGYYEIPVTLHSDSLCRLDVDVEIEFVQTQAALPDGITEAALAFDHSTLPQGEGGVISVRLPAGARVLPGQTTARVRGSFANSRVVYGPTGKFDPAGAVKVSPERAQASPLIFSENLALSSLDLLLTSTSRIAELAVDLVEDLDGKPGTQSALPAQANVGIDSQIAGKPTWVNISLPVEVQVKAGTRLWLVAQSLDGEAAWSVVSQAQLAKASEERVWAAGGAVAGDQANGVPLGIQYTDAGGLSWRAESAAGISGPLAGMAHLRQPSTRYQVPIALQVGDAESANRVDLSRFEPLGRVDFHLDFDEFAEAINQAASASAAAAPPVGEHLLNNEFEAWRRVGDTPRERVMSVPVGSKPARALALSPNGKLLYIAALAEESSTDIYRISIAVVDTSCHEFDNEFEIASFEDAKNDLVVSLNGLAVSPDGRRACVSIRQTITVSESDITQNWLTWVDLETRSLMGEPGGFSSTFGRPVFSPDGGRLYLLYSDRIDVLDVAGLEAEFIGDKQFERALVDVIEIDSPWQPVVQALSPDGSRLFVVVVDNNASASNAELRIYNLASQTLTVRVAVGSGSQFSLALNPDGSRAVVANGTTGEVMVFETRGGQRLGTIPVEGAQPVGVAVDPGGRLAFVLCERSDESTEGFVVYFDLARTAQGFIRPAIETGESPHDLTILPSGERLYVADNNGSDQSGYYLSSLALGAVTPEEWTLTSGGVQPVCALEPFRRVAVLGDIDVEKVKRASPRYPSAISQVVPVVCVGRYELSFWGLAMSSEAVAEVFWYGGDCGVQQTDRLSFQVYDREAVFQRISLRDQKTSDRWLPESIVLVLHRLTMVSPSGAELAEVRFTAPANEAAFLDRVSLQATANVLGNGDLKHLDEGRLVGWSLVPEGAAGVTLIAEAEGLRFRNNGTREAALEQTAAFPAQVPFELVFAGRAEASGSGVVPRLELVWLDAGSARVGSPISASIPAQNSNRVARRGDSPAGTAFAQLRVVVPSGANLLLQGITFEEVNVTTVPIYVIAQAPGDLNVSDLQVVYDVVPPAPPKRLPAGGLCPPTPPAGAPGQGKHGCCYCPHCGETDDLCNTHEGETPGGQPTLEGECCHCGAHVRQIGGGGRASPTVQGMTDQIRRAGAALTRKGTSPMVVQKGSGAALKSRKLNIVSLQKATARGGVPKLAQPADFVVLEEAALPSPAAAATVELPPIKEVAGVTAEFASAFTTAGLGTLDRLAAATPRKIAAALPIEDRKVAARIASSLSRNARRLFQKVSGPEAPDGG